MSHHRLLVIATLLALAAAGHAADRRPDQSRLRVMSLNAEFLWDGIAPEEGSSQVSFPWRGAPDEAAEHMEEVAEMIIAGDADIVLLVEVENLDALELLNSQFLTGQGYKAYLETGNDTFTGQDVGILTRIDPIDDRVEYDGRSGTSGNTVKSVTKNCVGRFDCAGEAVAILGLHLLAQPDNTTRVHQRQAQAAAATSIARQLQDEGFEVIVCGDFNDYDGQTLDHIDSTPITNVLAKIRAMDPADSEDDLVNVAFMVPQQDRYTAHWDKDGGHDVDEPHELTSIDHILASPGLVLASVSIPHDHDPVQVTDHYPVIVEITMTPSVTPPPAPPAAPQFRIAALLPNPSGDENLEEQVFIINAGDQAASLHGWTLRDASGQVWTLAGEVQPKQWRSIKRNGQPMAMTNSGDIIELVSPTGSVGHTASYTAAAEDIVITVTNQ